MSQRTRREQLEQLRQRYRSAGLEYKSKLQDQAQELLGYHRKAAIRVLRAVERAEAPRILTGRPVKYEPGLLLPWLRRIWEATDYACGVRLAAMLPEWIPAMAFGDVQGKVKVLRDLLRQGALILMDVNVEFLLKA